MPISEIEIGDTVIAYDEETGETGEYTVTDTISHEDESIAYVTINGEEIETTPWHLFYTSEGWTEAEDLQEGDSIVSLGGVYGIVDSVIIVDTAKMMYDLTVEEVHTFAVGYGDWVVHNSNGFCEIDADGNTIRQTGREFFGELDFRGLVQNRPLRDLTHQEIYNAFRRTNITPSNHAIMRLKHIRTYNLGMLTLNDFARHFNNGILVDANGGLVAIEFGRFEIIMNPITNIIVTVSPL